MYKTQKQVFKIKCLCFGRKNYKEMLIKNSEKVWKCWAHVKLFADFCFRIVKNPFFCKIKIPSDIALGLFC